MTYREFYGAILGNGDLEKDLRDFAATAIEKLDKVNQARAGKKSKKAIEFEAEVAELMAKVEIGETLLISECAIMFGTTTQKATAILNRAVELGFMTAEEIKITGKGKRLQYTRIIAEPIVETEAEVEAE